jgi:hypothetical protein
MSVSSGTLVAGDLDFALPHAISLAEAGEKLQDKRIGIFGFQCLCIVYLTREKVTFSATR